MKEDRGFSLDYRNKEIATRFLNEDLAIHWQVNGTRESFNRLLHHLQVKTNFKPYFEQAISHPSLFADNSVVADIGAGVCWTSAILARHPKVKIVYALDPSINRLKHAQFVTAHFGVGDKVKIIHGSFLEPNIPEKVDLILLCASLHHCFDEQIAGLFLNMKSLLKPNGQILIANDHYVTWVWSLKRLIGYLYHFHKRSELYYSLGKLRAPHLNNGEHWRTRRELEKIFNDHNFDAQFFIHKGDLCKDKHSLYHKLGWYYYHAILQLRT
jgi:SAM-dependent methyltransferase